ncbi:MAG: NUDIX domain-containing protein [Treponema sp.]
MVIRNYKGAGITIFKKQNDECSILLGKRTEKPQKGKWSIHGGGFENADKSLFETALREFREETRTSSHCSLAVRRK